MPRRVLDQVLAMQEKAVRFLRDVVGDPHRADEFAEMTPEQYAEHKHITIVSNPASGITILIEGDRRMAKPTREELEDRIDELEDENQALRDKLGSITDILDEDDEDSDDEGDDDDQD